MASQHHNSFYHKKNRPINNQPFFAFSQSSEPLSYEDVVFYYNDILKHYVQLEDSHRHLSERHHQSEDLVYRLNMRLTESTQKFEAFYQEHQKNLLELKKVQQELKEAKEANDAHAKLQHDLHDLAHSLSVAKSETVDLQKDVSEKQKSLDNSLKIQQQLKQDLRIAKKTVASSNNNLMSNLRELNEMISQKDELTSENERLIKKVTDLETSLKSLQKKQAQQAQELQKTQQALQSLKSARTLQTSQQKPQNSNNQTSVEQQLSDDRMKGDFYCLHPEYLKQKVQKEKQRLKECLHISSFTEFQRQTVLSSVLAESATLRNIFSAQTHSFFHQFFQTAKQTDKKLKTPERSLNLFFAMLERDVSTTINNLVDCKIQLSCLYSRTKHKCYVDTYSSIDSLSEVIDRFVSFLESQFTSFTNIPQVYQTLQTQVFSLATNTTDPSDRPDESTGSKPFRHIDCSVSVVPKDSKLLVPYRLIVFYQPNTTFHIVNKLPLISSIPSIPSIPSQPQLINTIIN